MDSFKAVIDVWRGRRQVLADALNVTVNDIAQYHFNDRLPPKHWLATARLAAAEGRDSISAEVLELLHKDRPNRLAAGNEASSGRESRLSRRRSKSRG